MKLAIVKQHTSRKFDDTDYNHEGFKDPGDNKARHSHRHLEPTNAKQLK